MRGGLLVGLLAALLAASCSLVPQPGVGATFEPGVEHLPAPGLARLSGDPERAPRDLLLEYVDVDGATSAQHDTVRAGSTIEGGFWSNPGTYRVAVNRTICEGTFGITGDQMTEVVVILSGDDCRTEIKAVTPILD